ncbi:MAG: cupredoxin family copper-binding protein [Candidatus Micrarchaeia archaeon]
MKPELLAVFLVFALFIAGCSQYQAPAQQPSTTPPATPGVSQQIPGAAVTEVAIKDFAFAPAEVTIAKGTNIKWVNKDAAPHQVKGSGSESTTLADGSSQTQGFSFDSGPLETGMGFEVTFNYTGTYDYICAIHPSMKGRIIVQ